MGSVRVAAAKGSGEEGAASIQLQPVAVRATLIKAPAPAEQDDDDEEEEVQEKAAKAEEGSKSSKKKRKSQVA